MALPASRLAFVAIILLCCISNTTEQTTNDADDNSTMWQDFLTFFVEYVSGNSGLNATELANFFSDPAVSDALSRLFNQFPGNFSGLSDEERIRLLLNAFNSSGLDELVLQWIVNSTGYTRDQVLGTLKIFTDFLEAADLDIADVIIFFSDPEQVSALVKLIQALPDDFFDLPPEDQTDEFLVAFNASGLDYDAFQRLLGAAGLSLPEFLEAVNQARLALILSIQAAAAQYQDALSQYGVGLLCSEKILVSMEALLGMEEWALQMFDALGKPGSGILRGQTTWLGSFDQCVSIKGSNYVSAVLANSTNEINGQYCGVRYSILPSRLNPLPTRRTLGLCVPDVCTEKDITGVVAAVLDQYFNESGINNPKVTCKLNELPVATETIIAICVLAVLGAWMVLGTLYDVSIQTGARTDNEGSKKALPINGQGSVSPAVINATGYLAKREGGKTVITDSFGDNKGSNWIFLPKHVPYQGHSQKGAPELTSGDHLPLNMPGETTAPKPTLSRLERSLLAFSLYSNVVKMFDVSPRAGSFTCVHGIRVLSLAWIVLAHTLYFAGDYADHAGLYIFEKMKGWTFMMIPNGRIAVDSFFACSGLFVAYLTLHKLRSVGGVLKFNWAMFYFHRFWRLTPPYMAVILFMVTTLRYLYNGPMWDQSEDSATEALFNLPSIKLSYCRDNWWTNILYINNLVKADEQCLASFWYLADDMQFFVLSPLLVIPLFYNVVAGVAVCVLCLAATITTAALIAKEHEYTAQPLDYYALPPKDKDYLTNFYYPPYTRMSPYIVGMVTGYILYRTKCVCRIPKIVNVICWLFSVGIMSVVVHGPFSDSGRHVMGVNESALHLSLAPTGWSVALCWIIFACVTGNGGFIDKLLSWKAFVPLSRLSFCVYLIHPLVMVAYYQGRRHAVYLTDYEMVYLFLAHLMASYGVAFCWSLTFEVPTIALEKILFGPGGKSSVSAKKSNVDK